jgi:hypothetical protein
MTSPRPIPPTSRMSGAADWFDCQEHSVACGSTYGDHSVNAQELAAAKPSQIVLT